MALWNKSVRKLFVLRRRSWHHNPPPNGFRQQYNQSRCCPNIVENKDNNSRSGPLEKNNLLEQRKCGLPAERICVTQGRKAKAVTTEARSAPQKQKSTNIHHKVMVCAINIMSSSTPPPGLEISHANTMREKIQHRQKVKTQQMKILRQGKPSLLVLLLFQSISK